MGFLSGQGWVPTHASLSLTLPDSMWISLSTLCPLSFASALRLGGPCGSGVVLDHPPGMMPKADCRAAVSNLIESCCREEDLRPSDLPGNVNSGQATGIVGVEARGPSPGGGCCTSRLNGMLGTEAVVGGARGMPTGLPKRSANASR